MRGVVDECIEVVLLMSGHVGNLAKLADHLRASSSMPVCLHLVSDVGVHRQAEQWGMTAHSLLDMPPEAITLHNSFKKVCHHNLTLRLTPPYLGMLPAKSPT